MAKQTEQLRQIVQQEIRNSLKEQLEDVSQDLRVVHENWRESLQIMQELNSGEKKETEPAEDAKEPATTSDNHQMEANTSALGEILEQPQAEEIQETKETGTNFERSVVDVSERQGERPAPNERGMEEKGAERTSSKPRKRRVKSRTAAGARRKKKTKFSKKTWELRKKTTHKKSKEAFQVWLDQVRQKPQQQTTEMQRYVPWDPGGFIYETRSSQVPDHRSQSPSLIATSTLMEATD
jgi:hypothetical protein